MHRTLNSQRPRKLSASPLYLTFMRVSPKSQSFQELCPRHEALPLCAMRQSYNGGGDTGLFLHTDFWTLYFVLSGSGLHVVNEHPYPVARGDVYIVPPGGVVGYRDYSGLSAFAFCWTTELFSTDDWNALRALPGFWPLMVPFEGEAQGEDMRRNCRLHFSPEAFRGIETDAREIAKELEAAESAAALVARGMLFRSLVHLARSNDKNELPQLERIAAPRFADVLRLIEERYAEPLTVPQLAARLFLSAGAFTELFRRETGVSPAAYLRRLRLDRAQTLLRETDDSVAHIAACSGFADAAHFSRAFRAAFALSPREYREQFR